MYSSNKPKLSQHTRNQIYQSYLEIDSDTFRKIYTQSKLASIYGVSRVTISKIIHRARDGDIPIGSPINLRYLTKEYVLRRQAKLELKMSLKLERKAKRDEIKKHRYEHKQAGDLGHIDLKLLAPIQGEKIVKGQKEYLLALVDDCTRVSYFTIIGGKNQYQVEAGLRQLLVRCPIKFKAILSDNGKEFKGVQYLAKDTGKETTKETAKYRPKSKQYGQTHAVELLLQELGIKHRYTRVRRPQTNGKVERLNRTIGEEFLTKVKFENRLHRLCHLRLWEYHYNQNRKHQGIKNQTPHQKYQSLNPLKFI